MNISKSQGAAVAEVIIHLSAQYDSMELVRFVKKRHPRINIDETKITRAVAERGNLEELTGYTKRVVIGMSLHVPLLP